MILTTSLLRELASLLPLRTKHSGASGSTLNLPALAEVSCRSKVETVFFGRLFLFKMVREMYQAAHAKLAPSATDPPKRSIPLKLKGPRSASANDSFIVNVINGSNRLPVEGAEVMGVKTDQDGKVRLRLHFGAHKLKAIRGDDITSNVLEVVVM